MAAHRRNSISQYSTSSPTPRYPQPPNDRELDLYFGPQLRWIAALSFISSATIILSFTMFISQRPVGLVLALPIGVNALGSLVSLVSSGRTRRYSLESHKERVENWMPDSVQSVDVFLPSAGEPIDLLRNTYEHVAQMRWLGPLKIMVLDDSGRDSVATLAEQYGFTYYSRPDRGFLKKAGNLRYGYEHSSADVIMILDADFAPRHDFLYQLMPYMDESRVGIVQSPQYFDFDRREMSWIEHGAGATQVLFYRWIQPSRDRSNAAICVGTCALYRREALTAAGGFAQIGHSEDVHTGFNVMNAGFSVRYVPAILAKGVCPDTFDSFVTQQYRWATGSLSLLFSLKFHKSQLTVMQRLCFWSGFLYFSGTGMSVFAAAIPPILMAAIFPEDVSWSNYALVFFALVLRAYMVPIITAGRCNLIQLARIQTTYSFAHAVALWDRLRSRSDSWVATGTKATSKTAYRVGRLSRSWMISVQVVLWFAVIIRAAQYGDAFVPLIAFGFFSLLVAVPVIARRDVKWFL